MLKSKHVLLLFSLLAIHHISLAKQERSGFQYSLFSGLTQAKIHPGQLLFEYEDDALIANRRRETSFTWGLGVAYYILTSNSAPIHDLSFGLSIFQFKAHQQGSTWQYQLPIYNNFTYKLPINSVRGMVGSEITLAPLKEQLFPFIEVAMGIARNKVSFSDKPVANFGGTGIFVKDNIHYHTAFSMGAGIKRFLCKNVAASLRYRYSNLGYAKTAQQSIVPLTSPLMVKLTTQDWLLGLTYTS